jgi:hypothetical protein
MILKQFVEQYLGKFVDYDKKFGAQCVDLYRQYCHDVLEMPDSESVEGAKHLWMWYEETRIQKKHLQKLDNTPDFIPNVGDIVIYGDNKFGHVAIVLFANVNKMIVFEQDGYAQDGAKPAMRNYNNVLGFLRLREEAL